MESLVYFDAVREHTFMGRCSTGVRTSGNVLYSTVVTLESYTLCTVERRVDGCAKSECSTLPSPSTLLGTTRNFQYIQKTSRTPSYTPLTVFIIHHDKKIRICKSDESPLAQPLSQCDVQSFLTEMRLRWVAQPP